jgi:hypothetical protein
VNKNPNANDAGSAKFWSIFMAVLVLDFRSNPPIYSISDGVSFAFVSIFAAIASKVFFE